MRITVIRHLTAPPHHPVHTFNAQSALFRYSPTYLGSHNDEKFSARPYLAGCREVTVNRLSNFWIWMAENGALPSGRTDAPWRESLRMKGGMQCGLSIRLFAPSTYK